MTIDDQIKGEKEQYNIHREAAKISVLSSGKISKYEYLRGEEILPSNQKQIIEQTEFILSRVLLKNKQSNWRSRKNQISVIKESGNQIIEWNEIGKNDFNIDRSGVLLDKQKETFNELVRERALEFSDIKDKIDPNNLIYVYSTGKSNPKGFGNYQMPMKLFEDLRDGEIDPKEILKNQPRLK